MADTAGEARAARALASKLARAACAGLRNGAGLTCIGRLYPDIGQEGERTFFEYVEPDLCCHACRRWAMAEILAQDLENAALIFHLPPSVRERLIRDAKENLFRVEGADF